MKKLLLTIIILGACLVGSSQNWDSVRVGNVDVDSIMLGGAKIWEKQTVTPPQFETVTIGTQTWMAVNLDVDDGGGGIYAYNDDESHVATYGRLYTWAAAIRVAVSVDGWHLPSYAEWTTLTTYLGEHLLLVENLKRLELRIGIAQTQVQPTKPDLQPFRVVSVTIMGYPVLLETPVHGGVLRRLVQRMRGCITCLAMTEVRKRAATTVRS